MDSRVCVSFLVECPIFTLHVPHEHMSSFEVLGLAADCSHKDVLKAWRKLALLHHPDKAIATDASAMQALNAAKDLCLKALTERDFAVSEREYVMHICRVLEKSLADNCDVHLDLGEGELVQPTLRKFFYIRAAIAVEWVMLCGMGEAAFDQETEDEIPTLCSFYNNLIGRDDWSEKDETMLLVLNRYDRMKAGGYGNFARFIEHSVDKP